MTASRSLAGAALALALGLPSAASAAHVPPTIYQSVMEAFSPSALVGTPDNFNITSYNLFDGLDHAGTVAGVVNSSEFASVTTSGGHGGSVFIHAEGADDIMFARGDVVSFFRVAGPTLPGGGLVSAEVLAHMDFAVTGSGQAQEGLAISPADGSGGPGDYLNYGIAGNFASAGAGIHSLDVNTVFGFRPNTTYAMLLGISTSVNFQSYDAFFDPSVDGTPYAGSTTAFIDPQIVIDPEFADRYHIVGGLLGSPDTGGGVPEPAAWALMLVGFGGLGAALRARRRQAAQGTI